MANQQGRHDSTMTHRRLGLWMIGAFGSVGSSVALGLAALRQQLIDTTGLVTSLPVISDLALPEVTEFEIGGHDIASGHLATSAEQVGGMRPAYLPSLIATCRPQLDEWSQQIRPGTDWQSKTLSTLWDRICNDLTSFRIQHQLDHVIVVNLASTEAESEQHSAQDDRAALERELHNGNADALSASSWYAFAAIHSGCSYVNFTPSSGAGIPALIDLARERKVALAGQDGKTGETLVKTVLAPMFARRNLKVLSWIGHNLLGNNDGWVLSNPAHRAAKLKNKDRVVADILGYQPETLTSIDFVASLDDWKTAWDHVHFQGFLGVPMSMQFTWQGCDSALAAPLVIDLARLVALAQSRGEVGILPHLALFFKAPQGCGEHDFAKQWMMLESYAQKHL